MNSTLIPQSVLAFLTDLAANNDREWFKANKDRYLEEHAHMVAFAESLFAEISKHDVLEPMTGKQILYRIYRDTRFSKDKTPYKRHFAGSFKRATARRRGGLYFHIEPGNSFLGGGFWGPNKEDLTRIRKELAADPEPLRQIIAEPSFVKTFGELKGEKVKTAPRGYTKDHPSIDLLRYKQFLLVQSFSDDEVTSPGFAGKVAEGFHAMRPFLDYMTEVLTTDENGVPII
jgi:uncharacterized protein (TIGR02453 family)